LLNLPAESGETGVPGIRFKPLASAANRYELQYVAAIAVGPASSQTLDEHLSSRTKALVRRELANGPRSDEISLN
jgi:hypothetical protein